MHGGRFAGENSLMKAAVRRAEHRSAISCKPHGQAEARRNHVPLIQSSETMDGRSGLVSLRVVCGQIRTDRASVIETKSEARREPIGESDGVQCVQSGGDELAAARRGLAVCRLNRLTCTIG